MAEAILAEESEDIVLFFIPTFSIFPEPVRHMWPSVVSSVSRLGLTRHRSFFDITYSLQCYGLVIQVLSLQQYAKEEDANIHDKTQYPKSKLEDREREY